MLFIIIVVNIIRSSMEIGYLRHFFQEGNVILHELNPTAAILKECLFISVATNDDLENWFPRIDSKLKKVSKNEIDEEESNKLEMKFMTNKY